MAKEDNLMPIEEVNSRRTPEQHSEDSRKAGIRSGEVRREKATMKKTLEMLLDEKNEKLGKTYRDLTTLGLIKGATEGKAENYKLIMQVLGELQEQQSETPSVQINIVDNSELEKALYEQDNT